MSLSTNILNCHVHLLARVGISPNNRPCLDFRTHKRFDETGKYCGIRCCNAMRPCFPWFPLLISLLLRHAKHRPYG